MSRPPVTVKLTEPIMAHGEKMTELTIRAPTGKDARIHGVPYQVGHGGALIIDGDAMSRLLVDLCQVPLSSIDSLSFQDWNAAMQAVLGFTGPAQAETPPPVPSQS